MALSNMELVNAGNQGNVVPSSEFNDKKIRHNDNLFRKE